MLARPGSLCLAWRLARPLAHQLPSALGDGLDELSRAGAPDLLDLRAVAGDDPGHTPRDLRQQRLGLLLLERDLQWLALLHDEHGHVDLLHLMVDPDERAERD